MMIKWEKYSCKLAPTEPWSVFAKIMVTAILSLVPTGNLLKWLTDLDLNSMEFYRNLSKIAFWRAEQQDNDLIVKL